jgi:protein-tyrosine phosphatase
MTLNQTAVDSVQARDRLLAWEGCLNARDLGGYLTSDGRTTKWGAIVRSDLLTPLTPSGKQALRDYGIRTIIDLRMASELEDDPNPFATPGDHGITYLHRSFINGDDLSGPFETLTDAYIAGLQHHAPTIGKVMSTIASAQEGGMLIHCHGGRDRTGTIAAFLLELAGVPRTTIGDDYALSTECLRPRDEHYLENGPGDRADRERYLAKWATRPEVMIGMLDWLDQTYGDVPAYLRHVGVADYEMELLRHRLVG